MSLIQLVQSVVLSWQMVLPATSLSVFFSYYFIFRLLIIVYFTYMQRYFCSFYCVHIVFVFFDVQCLNQVGSGPAAGTSIYFGYAVIFSVPRGSRPFSLAPTSTDVCICGASNSAFHVLLVILVCLRYSNIRTYQFIRWTIHFILVRVKNRINFCVEYPQYNLVAYCNASVFASFFIVIHSDIIPLVRHLSNPFGNFVYVA